jgi:hypothetical protein
MFRVAFCIVAFVLSLFFNGGFILRVHHLAVGGLSWVLTVRAHYIIWD